MGTRAIISICVPRRESEHAPVLFAMKMMMETVLRDTADDHSLQSPSRLSPLRSHRARYLNGDGVRDRTQARGGGEENSGNGEAAGGLRTVMEELQSLKLEIREERMLAAEERKRTQEDRVLFQRLWRVVSEKDPRVLSPSPAADECGGCGAGGSDVVLEQKPLQPHVGASQLSDFASPRVVSTPAVGQLSMAWSTRVPSRGGGDASSTQGRDNDPSRQNILFSPPEAGNALARSKRHAAALRQVQREAEEDSSETSTLRSGDRMPNEDGLHRVAVTRDPEGRVGIRFMLMRTADGQAICHTITKTTDPALDGLLSPGQVLHAVCMLLFGRSTSVGGESPAMCVHHIFFVAARARNRARNESMVC